MMRNLLKKLHIMPVQSEEGMSSSSPSQQPQPPPPGSHRHHPEQKPPSGLSGWLNSVTGRHNSSPPSSGRGERSDQTDDAGSLSLAGLESALLETVRRDSEDSSVRDPEMEEEYQIQLALELSAREDPEAVQIEAVKQISLGSCAPQNTPAEVLAYRYWNYNSLGYDDKIMDGFYDLYGILGESTSEMPSLIDLQQTPVSDNISWEAMLVNRAEDGDLLSLEERALMMAVASRSGSTFFTLNDLVRKLAALVAEYMGGPVVDPEKMLKDWSNFSNHLRALVGNMVLPLGRLKIGLARHRALLFKVLADSVGVPCRLIKGQQYTGADDGAMNIIKIDGREYIVDVMAEPGTLIPSDAVGPQMEYEGPFFELSPVRRGASSSHIGSCSINSGVSSSIDECPEYAAVDKTSRSGNLAIVDSGFDERCGLGESSGQETRPASSSKESSSKGPQADSSDEKSQLCGSSGRPSPPYAHGRSPSWTEGVSSPAVRRMKVKDVSQYMIDAAKENPKLAQKLHDVLLESGVVAPPDLFTEAYSEQLPSPTDGRNQTGDTDEKKQRKDGTRHRHQADVGQGRYLPPLPHHGMQPKLNPSRMQIEQEACSSSSHSEASAISTQEMLSPGNFVKHMPVAAAAAATAAVVASSMVVAAAKSSTDSCLEVPVAAAATATAAAVVATTAAVSRQYEQLESGALLLGGAPNLTQPDRQKDGDGDGVGNGSQGSDHKHASGDKLEHGSGGAHQEGERISDRSTGTESVRSEAALEDVAEWEILWDEITLGERIGLGSYGEVYRGDWHGTEVAVKKFLDQDISGDALAEFISEVRIMKRLRHPNVVLFMGAVIRAPHLSIVTEFLRRGSLYRLIHRPNNQLDERKRLKMALDVARGMNYLHNFKPAIVHRDLKSPNLLVDRNWNVKVCDFGLSRMKHNTFLSSSTAGTAEWMAPEVLQNEPSDEKCDVYSYGVILWELTTMQQPWSGMNPMQVVGAVGFQHRRLDIPDDVDPVIADIIKKCWQTDPKLRPSFSEIMAALRPLQKSLVSQVSTQRASLGGNRGLHPAGQQPERDQAPAGDDEV